MPTNFKQLSKREWEGENTLDNINTGCLQRIADATEKMAGNYTQLQNQVKMLQNSLDIARNTRDEYYRKISALKGVITKLKKKK